MLANVGVDAVAAVAPNLKHGSQRIFSDELRAGEDWLFSNCLSAAGVGGNHRGAALPDVPSTDDFVPGYEASAKRRAIKWSSDNAPGPRASSNRKHVAHTP